MNSSAISVSDLRKACRDKTVLDGTRTTRLDPFEQGAASGTPVREIVR